jgi:hypothetical protein
VQADRVDRVRHDRAVQRDDPLVDDHEQRAGHHFIDVADDRAGLAARQKRAVRAVGTVGEALGVHGDARVPAALASTEPGAHKTGRRVARAASTTAGTCCTA